MGTVSAASIICMFITMFVSVFTPIALFIWWKVKSKASWVPALIGATIFFVFALTIEQAFHMVVMGLTGELINGNIWLLALYGGLCAGLFEETGRLIAMKGLMRNILKKENAIMYGIGHGGIESILVIGISYVSNIVTAFAVNANALPSALDMSDPTIYESVSKIWTTPASMFLMAGVERISAIVLHICLSYLVYKAVKEKKISRYFIAVLIHMAVDTGTVLLNQVVPVYVLEAVLIAFMVVFALFTVRAYKAEE